MIASFLTGPLQDAALVGGLATAAVIAWVFARQGAAKAWREVAESRQAKIEEQETVISEMRERIARLEAQVTHLQRHDLSAVMEWGRSHEESAAARHEGTMGVLEQIRDRLPNAA